MSPSASRRVWAIRVPGVGRIAPLAAAVALAACGADGVAAPGPADDDRLLVATTVAPITSIVGQIAGGRADVRGIVPEGVNSHTFEPRPSDAELLSEADLIVLNGLFLEEPTRELAEANAREDAVILELGTEVLPRDEWIFDFSFPEAEGRPNPHLWTEPAWVRAYAGEVADVLSEADPGNAAAYRDNEAALLAALDDFEAALDEALATVPPANRRLLTYHDSFAYFAAPRDDWDVIGAIQVSDFGEPTPREVGELIEQVRSTSVPAIFGSEVFPSPVLEQIGAETGVRYVDVLRDDDLPGDAGDDDHSLIGLLRFDYATIVDALGGDATPLEALMIPDLPDDAEYPQ